MKQIKKILVPIDFSEISERVIKLALFMAENFQAEMTVLFVAEDMFTELSGFAMGDLPIVQIEQDIFENSTKRLKSFVERHCSHHFDRIQRQVLRGRVAGEILEWSAANKVDLIIMGTHGYSGFEKMFMGSVTDRVVKLAACPVLTTR